MKTLYLTFLSPENKSGLFHSSHNRILHSIHYLAGYTIINFQVYDGLILRFLKYILGKQFIKKGPDSFVYEDLLYKNVWLKKSFFSTLNIFPFFERFRFLKILCNENFIKESDINSIITNYDFDFINAHWGYPSGSFAYQISIKCQKPYFITFHGSDINSIPFRNLIMKRIMSKIIRNATINFMVSKALVQKANSFVKCYNSFVIYNGVRKRDYIADYKINNKIIFVGNLNDDKRADVIPSIVKKIINKLNGNVEFKIIGSGIYFKKIQSDLKEFNNSVKILGHIPNIKTLRHIEDSQILILPSRREGFPLVILEAIISKTIPIASNVGGIAELLDKKFLVNESINFIDDFCDKILYNLKTSHFPNFDLDKFYWNNIAKNELTQIKSFVSEKN